MDKNKMFYITLVLVVCVVLTGIGCFYLGTKFGENNSEGAAKKVEVKEKNTNETKDDTSYIEELLSINIDDVTKMGLYNYSISGKTSLKEYLESLDNNHKLDLAGLAIGSDKIFKDLRQNLIKSFGSDLGVEAKDVYLVDKSIPTYVYDSASDKFIYNEDSPGTDVVTNLGDISLYNYELKDI